MMDSSAAIISSDWGNVGQFDSFQFGLLLLQHRISSGIFFPNGGVSLTFRDFEVKVGKNLIYVCVRISARLELRIVRLG
jgi:hypothetical protein